VAPRVRRRRRRRGARRAAAAAAPAARRPPPPARRPPPAARRPPPAACRARRARCARLTASPSPPRRRPRRGAVAGAAGLPQGREAAAAADVLYWGVWWVLGGAFEGLEAGAGLGETASSGRRGRQGVRRVLLREGPALGRGAGVLFGRRCKSGRARGACCAPQPGATPSPPHTRARPSSCRPGQPHGDAGAAGGGRRERAALPRARGRGARAAGRGLAGVRVGLKDTRRKGAPHAALRQLGWVGAAGAFAPVSTSRGAQAKPKPNRPPPPLPAPTRSRSRA
jgi:hypothetical protein